jgi:hypothetical protein
LVHPQALFDHMLYCQADESFHDYLDGWERSREPASKFLSVQKTAGIVEADSHCYRRPLAGELENRDTLLGKRGAIPSLVSAGR